MRLIAEGGGGGGGGREVWLSSPPAVVIWTLLRFPYRRCWGLTGWVGDWLLYPCLAPLIPPNRVPSSPPQVTTGVILTSVTPPGNMSVGSNRPGGEI